MKVREAWKRDKLKPDERRWAHPFAAGECKTTTPDKSQVAAYLFKLMQVPGAGASLCFSLHQNILQVFVATPSAIFSTTPLYRLGSPTNSRLFDHFFLQSRDKNGPYKWLYHSVIIHYSISPGNLDPLGHILLKPPTQVFPKMETPEPSLLSNLPTYAFVDKFLLTRHSTVGRGTTILHVSIPSNFFPPLTPAPSSSFSLSPPPLVKALLKISFIAPRHWAQPDVVERISEAESSEVSHLGKVDLVYREQLQTGIPGMTPEAVAASPYFKRKLQKKKELGGLGELGGPVFREQTMLISREIYEAVTELETLEEIYIVILHSIKGV